MDPITPRTRAEDIMEMLASVPIRDIKEQVQHLLHATRTVSMGRDREPVQEPDNQVRLRIVELLVAQQAGQAASRKPIEPPKPTGENRPEPGTLRVKVGAKSDVV